MKIVQNERWDVPYARRLLQTLNTKRFLREQEAMIVKCLFAGLSARENNDGADVVYRRSKRERSGPRARLYAQDYHTFLRFPRDIRASLAAKHYVEYDMSKSMPRLFIQIMEKRGLTAPPELAAFVAAPQAFIEKIRSEATSPVEEPKTTILAICNQAPAKPARTFGSATLGRLRREMVCALRQLGEQGMHHVCEQAEFNCLKAATLFFEQVQNGREVGALIHDAVFVEKRPAVDDGDTSEALSKFVKSKVGFNTVWVRRELEAQRIAEPEDVPTTHHPCAHWSEIVTPSGGFQVSYNKDESSVFVKDINLSAATVHCVRAPMGSGKTTMVKRLFNEGKIGRVLLLACRRTLGRKQKADFAGSIHYKEPHQNDGLRAAYNNNSSASISTLQSLYQINLSDPNYRDFDTVVIDEVRTQAEAVTCPVTNARRMRRNLQLLRHIAKAAKRVILLDCDMFFDDVVPRFIRVLYSGDPATTIKIAVTNYEHLRDCARRVMQPTGDADVWFQKLSGAIESGKKIACGFKHARQLEVTAHRLKKMHRGLKLRCYCNDLKDQSLEGGTEDWNEMDRLLEAGDVQVVFFSSKCAVGLDVSFKIHQTFLSFANTNGSTSANGCDGRTLSQMSMRFRYVVNPNVECLMCSPNDKPRPAFALQLRALQDKWTRCTEDIGAHIDFVSTYVPGRSELLTPTSVTELAAELLRTRAERVENAFKRAIDNNGFGWGGNSTEKITRLLLPAKDKGTADAKAKMEQLSDEALEAAVNRVASLLENTTVGAVRNKLATIKRAVEGEEQPSVADRLQLRLFGMVNYMRREQLTGPDTDPFNEGDIFSRLATQGSNTVDVVRCFMEQGDKITNIQCYEASLSNTREHYKGRVATRTRETTENSFPGIAPLTDLTRLKQCDALSTALRHLGVDPAAFVEAGTCTIEGGVIDEMAVEATGELSRAFGKTNKTAAGLLKSVFSSFLGAHHSKTRPRRNGGKRSMIYTFKLDPQIAHVAHSIPFVERLARGYRTVKEVNAQATEIARTTGESISDVVPRLFKYTGAQRRGFSGPRAYSNFDDEGKLVSFLPATKRRKTTDVSM